MNRNSFLKLLGVSVVAPTVYVDAQLSKPVNAKTDVVKFKQYPIYPDRNEWWVKMNNGDIQHNLMSYVKINRNNEEYLVLVRECGINSEFRHVFIRFENSVKRINEEYKISESFPQLYLKYNPKIHK